MALLLVLVAVGLAACGGASGPAAPERRHMAAGVSVPVPAGWRVAARSLTPALIDPAEVLSLGTGPLRSAAGRRCAHLPEAAVRALGAEDVLVTVQERDGGRGFPARRRPFALGPASAGDAARCAGRTDDVREHRVPFREAGRSFSALVVLGRAVPEARRRQVRRVLDGLRVAPATPFAVAPAAVRGRLPPGWRVVRRRLTAAVGPRHQVAAGSFAVPDGPPDRNCSPAAAVRRLPDDGALVFVFEYADAGPRLLARFPRRPRRFRLPARAQPYECFGESRLVRWRERGRAFQAHVWLGARAPAWRSREVVRFLDALQAAPR